LRILQSSILLEVQSNVVSNSQSNLHRPQSAGSTRYTLCNNRFLFDCLWIVESFGTFQTALSGRERNWIINILFAILSSFTLEVQVVVWQWSYGTHSEKTNYSV
jgi:histone deacetylase complex regulatory component SIN3